MWKYPGNEQRVKENACKMLFVEFKKQFDIL